MVELKIVELFNTLLEIVSKVWPEKKTAKERASQLATEIRMLWNRAVEDVPASERVGLLRQAMDNFEELEKRHPDSTEAAELAESGGVRGVTREALREALLSAERRADESNRNLASAQTCLDRVRQSARSAVSHPSINAYFEIAEAARECIEDHAASETADSEELHRRIAQAKRAIIGAYADCRNIHMAQAKSSAWSLAGNAVWIAKAAESEAGGRIDEAIAAANKTFGLDKQSFLAAMTRRLVRKGDFASGFAAAAASDDKYWRNAILRTIVDITCLEKQFSHAIRAADQIDGIEDQAEAALRIARTFVRDADTGVTSWLAIEAARLDYEATSRGLGAEQQKIETIRAVLDVAVIDAALGDMARYQRQLIWARSVAGSRYWPEQIEILARVAHARILVEGITSAPEEIEEVPYLFLRSFEEHRDETEPFRIGHAISAWFDVLAEGKYFEHAKRFLEMSKSYDRDWAQAYCYSLGRAGHFDELIENSQQIRDPVDRCAILTYVARDAAREHDISNADRLCGIAAQMLDREGIPIGRHPVYYPVSSVIDEVAEILDCGGGVELRDALFRLCPQLLTIDDFATIGAKLAILASRRTQQTSAPRTH